MNLLFTFSDNTQIESPFITDGAKITQNYYKELKVADNSATVRIPFNKVLCDKLKADINKNIKVEIKEGSSNIFTGYVRKTIGFSKTQRNQPFSLEIVSPALLLNVNYNGNVLNYINKTLAEIVSNLLALTSFGGSINTSALHGETLLIFSISSGENIANVLEELLYEYGYIYQFDENGNFYLATVFDTPIAEITQHFNGDNCLGEISQNVKEDAFNQVVVNWNKVGQRTNVVIFEDTTNADTNNVANIEIPASQYYLGEEHNLCNYDSKFQKILWITETDIDIEYADSSVISQSFENLGTQGDLSIFNASNSSNFIHKLQIRGNGYFEISTNQIKVGQSGTSKDISTKYIQQEVPASTLAKKLADYYNYANFTLSVTSKTKYEIGTFCDVSDYGIGTIKARIVSRVWNIKENNYIYTLESVSEYDPAEIYVSNQFVNSNNDNGETIRDTLNNLNTKVDNIKTDTTIVNADNLTAFLNVDDNLQTVSTTTIQTTITLRQSDMDLPFTIGNLALPTGWTYSISGKTITFTVGEGVTIKAGKFAIPIQYRVPIGEEQYYDEDDVEYEDEVGKLYKEQIMSKSYTQWTLYFQYFADNGGIYLGMISSLAGIPHANYGDYMTWGGANNTPSTLSIDGVFKQGRVYKYVGNKKAWSWEQDVDIGHNQKASSDVYGIANADLYNNNSTLWEYLDHLTANSIYVDLLVANSAFIDRLKTNLVSAGMITTGQMTESSANAKIQATKDTLSSLGLSATESGGVVIADGYINAKYINAEGLAVTAAKQLQDSADGRNYTVITGGKIVTDLIDVNSIKATSGFFDNITVTGNLVANAVYLNFPSAGDNVFLVKYLYGGDRQLLPAPGIPSSATSQLTITSSYITTVKITVSSDEGYGVNLYRLDIYGNKYLLAENFNGEYILNFNDCAGYYLEQNNLRKVSTIQFKCNYPAGTIGTYFLQTALKLDYSYRD